MLAWAMLACTMATPAAWSPQAPPSRSPLDATYRIDGELFTLVDGQVIVPTVPGAASQTVVRLQGDPVRGDLDGDGMADAALLLVQTTGGSGTFYYLAAALYRDGLFYGTRAIFVGDRITPLQLTIRHGLVSFDYADRRPGEAMATPPSLPVAKYLVWLGTDFADVPLAGDEIIAAGHVVIGHEVQSFSPCGTGRPAWLTDDSPALPAILAAYQEVMADAPPSAPLFMVLTGRAVAEQAERLAAGYPEAFQATNLVLARPGFDCRSDRAGN